MPRVAEMHGKGYGMPSSHAQFMTFFAISLSGFLLFRHAPTPSTSYSPSTLLERGLFSMLACCGAAAVAGSRVYLSYHTPRQVLAGVAAGLSFAMLWFVLTSYLRKHGWVDRILDTALARALRMRDLIMTEDLPDAGWGRWESKRRIRRNLPNGGSKKFQ